MGTYRLIVIVIFLLAIRKHIRGRGLFKKKKSSSNVGIKSSAAALFQDMRTSIPGNHFLCNADTHNPPTMLLHSLGKQICLGTVETWKTC